MIITWTTLFSILASMVPLSGAIYKLLLIRYQKLWAIDITKAVEAIEKRHQDNIKSLEIDILKQVDTKFELIRKDLDGLTDVIKELKIIAERSQELQIESKIEEARSSTKLEALDSRTTRLETVANAVK